MSKAEALSCAQLAAEIALHCEYYLKMAPALHDGAPLHQCALISTSNCETRPEPDWNRFRREIHDLNKVAEHAFWTAKVLFDLKVDLVLVQLSREGAAWFPKALSRKVNMGRINYLSQILNQEVESVQSFSGGIRFAGVAVRFINLFLDYPYVNRYVDIEILCAKKPLVIKFTHHLTVDFWTLDRRLISSIDTSFRSRGFKVVPGFSE